jgi:hypothetical protein
VSGAQNKATRHGFLLLVAVTAAVSCGGGVSGPVAPLTVQGRWTAPNQVPGSSTVFDLLLADSTVAGTGTYTIEAGPSGTISVTGTATALRVDLDLARSDGLVGHFRGRLVTADSMSGSLYFTGLPYGNDPIIAAFVRVVPLKL